MKIRENWKGVRLLPSMVGLKGIKHLEELDLEDADTLTLLIHPGYIKYHLIQGRPVKKKKQIERLGNYDIYLKNLVEELPKIRKEDGLIIFYLEKDQWRYIIKKKEILPTREDFIVFTENNRGKFYFPDEGTFFGYLKSKNISRVKICGELVWSGEDFWDRSCLRTVCDLCLDNGFEVEPLTDCSFPLNPPSEGDKTYYTKKILSEKDMSLSYTFAKYGLC